MKVECHECGRTLKARLDSRIDQWRVPYHKHDRFRCEGSMEIADYDLLTSEDPPPDRPAPVALFPWKRL